MINRNVVLALAGSFMLSACASIVTGTKQSIKVDSNPQGAKVYTAVRSKKDGQQGALLKRVEAGVTPTTVSVARKDGVIELEKDGYDSAEVPLDRGMNNWVWGDIVLTSLLSTSIDTSTGAAWSYDPDQYVVNLKPAGSTPSTAAPTATAPANTSAPK